MCIKSLHMDNRDSTMCYLTWLEHNFHLLLLDSWRKNCGFLTVWELGQCNRVIIRLCSVISWLGLGKTDHKRQRCRLYFFAPPLVGHLLRLNGWPCQCSHHSLTQSHSLWMPHTHLDANLTLSVTCVKTGYFYVSLCRALVQHQVVV